MGPPLSLEDRRPLYVQLRDALLERIARGALAYGEKLPPEPELARQYGVGIATVRRAVSDLVLAGQLIRRQGLGTFVARPRYGLPTQEVWGFTEHMRRLGLEPESRLLLFDKTIPPKDVALRLGQGGEEKAWCLKFLRSVQGEPFLLETTYLPVGAFPRLRKSDLATGSLYAFLKARYGVSLTGATEYVEPILLDASLAKLLQVPRGEPALHLQRLGLAQDGRCVEVTDSVIRGDRCRIYWQVVRGPDRPAEGG